MEELLNILKDKKGELEDAERELYKKMDSYLGDKLLLVRTLEEELKDIERLKCKK
jgi:hypothetical protein